MHQRIESTQNTQQGKPTRIWIRELHFVYTTYEGLGSGTSALQSSVWDWARFPRPLLLTPLPSYTAGRNHSVVNCHRLMIAARWPLRQLYQQYSLQNLLLL